MMLLVQAAHHARGGAAGVMTRNHHIRSGDKGQEGEEREENRGAGVEGAGRLG